MIRPPTFLGQTDVASFSLIFSRDALTSSRERLIPLDERPRRPRARRPPTARVPGVSLRCGARRSPGSTAGGTPADKRKRPGGTTVFDSGTTGCLVSRRVVRLLGRCAGHVRVPRALRGRGGGAGVHRDESEGGAGRCLFLPLPVDVPWEGVPRDERLRRARVHVQQRVTHRRRGSPGGSGSETDLGPRRRRRRTESSIVETMPST